MSSDVPSFHDGSVMGVVLGKELATLYMRQSSGQEFTLTLEGLEFLQMEDFREGNIVLSFEIVTRNMPYKNIPFNRLFVPPHHLAETQYHERYQAFVTRQISRIASGETKLIIILPSLGADLLAICREVTCRRF